jgi:hypothetical protein
MASVVSLFRGPIPLTSVSSRDTVNQLANRLSMGVVMKGVPSKLKSIIDRYALSDLDNYVISDEFSLRESITDLQMYLSASEYRKLRRIVNSNSDLTLRIEDMVKEQAATTGIHGRLSKGIRNLIRSSDI